MITNTINIYFECKLIQLALKTDNISLVSSWVPASATCSISGNMICELYFSPLNLKFLHLCLQMMDLVNLIPLVIALLFSK